MRSTENRARPLLSMRSTDVYQLDMYHHGGPHIDRYTRQGHLVGRYRLDGTGILRKRVHPPSIPVSDIGRFNRVAIRGGGAGIVVGERELMLFFSTEMMATSALMYEAAVVSSSSMMMMFAL